MGSQRRKRAMVRREEQLHKVSPNQAPEGRYGFIYEGKGLEDEAERLKARKASYANLGVMGGYMRQKVWKAGVAERFGGDSMTAGDVAKAAKAQSALEGRNVPYGEVKKRKGKRLPHPLVGPKGGFSAKQISKEARKISAKTGQNVKLSTALSKMGAARYPYRAPTLG